jgi:putative ABC transport system substrate-binding protein
VITTGGNVTGFVAVVSSTGGKWMELLKEIAPRVKEALVLVDPQNPTWRFHVPAIEAAGQSLAVSVVAAHVHSPDEIERAIDAFAGKPNGGMIVLASPFAQAHRELTIRLAARHRLPAVYGARLYVASGGLLSYSSDWVEQYRQAASYVDRILKGARPAPPRQSRDRSYRRRPRAPCSLPCRSRAPPAAECASMSEAPTVPRRGPR